MQVSDLYPEKPVGDGGTKGKAASGGSPADAAQRQAPLQSLRKPDSRARPVLLLGLLAAVGAWLAYDSAQQTPAARTQASSAALNAAGGWWNVAGDRYLELDWEGRRATLWDYSETESGVESDGTWRSGGQTILVEVSGAAGSLTQEYEVVGNDAELFLAPTPLSTARLVDSWIADHGNEDDEDVGPGHSVSREAVWQPHHYAGHPRHPRAYAHTVARGT